MSPISGGSVTQLAFAPRARGNMARIKSNLHGGCLRAIGRSFSEPDWIV